MTHDPTATAIPVPEMTSRSTTAVGPSPQGPAASAGPADAGGPAGLAEPERHHLEWFLDSIVENVLDMIFVKDARELRFVRVNRAAELLLGRPRHELLGKNDYDLWDKEKADYFVGKDRAVLESGRMLDIPEETMPESAGSRVLHTKKIPVLDEQGRPAYLLGISRDITDRKRAEEKLREQNRLLEEAVRSERAAHQALKRAQAQMVQAEKMAALGQLVAGVAHEINNPLALLN